MSKSRRVTGLRIAGLCGVASPVITLAFIFLAISCSPWFSWTENALSDLGVNGNAAIIFNSGLIVGGLLTIIFALGLREIWRSRTLSHAGSLILILSAVCLCAIGVFPETAGDLHLYVSVAFFTLLPISLFFIGSTIIREPPERNLGFFTVLAGVVMLVVWILPWGEGVAIPEMLASLAASSWSIVWGTTLFRRLPLFNKTINEIT